MGENKVVVLILVKKATLHWQWICVSKRKKATKSLLKGLDLIRVHWTETGCHVHWGMLLPLKVFKVCRNVTDEEEQRRSRAPPKAASAGFPSSCNAPRCHVVGVAQPPGRPCNDHDCSTVQVWWWTGVSVSSLTGLRNFILHLFKLQQPIWWPSMTLGCATSSPLWATWSSDLELLWRSPLPVTKILMRACFLCV